MIANDIVTLKTRLKRLTDCVNSYSNNLQIAGDDGKPKKVQHLSPCDGSKGESASTWIGGIVKPTLNGVRDR